MKSDTLKYLLMLFLCVGILPALLTTLAERSRTSVLSERTCYEEAFREQCLDPALYDKITELAKQGADTGDLLTSTMLNGAFYPENVSEDKEAYLKYKKQEYFFLRQCYEAVWADLVCFPVPSDDISYEDTWLAARDYGGKRSHEGTDLFGKVEKAGYYPIISITDGVVEQKGWLPLGGYRIGIRSEHGGYFYYAHLSEYGRDFTIGEAVSAGDILGFMGNTGYGPEGTTGQFPVHLHLGIYIQGAEGEELSVNPYWILRSIEKNKRKYTY